jgi:hypothetical protein
MECATGVRTAPMGAGWIWNTLADSACSHHIPSLAPAVALPAPRHDRRRTGAAGSPPGGFPFVEFRRAVVKCAPARGGPRQSLLATHKTPLIPAPAFAGVNSSRNPRLRVPGERSETRDPDTRSAALIPATEVPATPASRGAPRGAERGRTEERISGHSEQIYTRPRRLRWTVGTRFATGRSPCGATAAGVSGA